MPDIYSTKTMLSSINQMLPVYTFFRDTFFPNTVTSPTEEVEVDYKKGKRKMAPFVAPRRGGVVVTRDGFTTKSYKVPKIAPVRIMTADDLSRRSMGENPYSAKDPEDRAKELLATDMIELDDMITRREEWMCREVMLNGKVLMEGEGFEQQVDYKFTNRITLTGNAKWTNEASDPLADLKDERKRIIKKCGKAPNILVFSSDAIDIFVNHPKVKDKLDNRRMNYGNIEPTIKNDAITFYGKLPELGVEIYSYDEWFLDDEDNEVPMMPEKTVIFASKGQHKRLYGAVRQIENKEFVVIQGERVPKSWVDDENEVRKIRITSKPLPCPDDVDSWSVIKIA